MAAILKKAAILAKTNINQYTKLYLSAKFHVFLLKMHNYFTKRLD